LKRLSESGIIQYIRGEFGENSSRVIKGIGDDAAVFRAGEYPVITTIDLLMERVHFNLEYFSAADLGHKSLAVNLSDLAAMGAEPRWCFLAMALRKDLTEEFIKEFFRGMKDLLDRHSVELLGGDITGTKKDVCVCITLIGEGVGPILNRDAARPGHDVYLTGYTGLSAAGLQLLLNSPPEEMPWMELLRKNHLRPEPQLEKGRSIARQNPDGAMIDISDGVVLDMTHICEESKVGALIYTDSLPVAPELSAFCRWEGSDPLKYMLHGGEDFQLLFTAPKQLRSKLEADYLRIGEITPHSCEVELVTKEGKTPTKHAGFNHFEIK
jgi:thiamine-monophosphate kinase